MNRSPHSTGRKLLKALALLCLLLAAPLVLLILIQVSGLAGPGFLYSGSQFLGDQMLIAAGALLIVALLAGISSRVREPRPPLLRCGSGWRLALYAIGIGCLIGVIAMPAFLHFRRSTPNPPGVGVETLSPEAMRQREIEVRENPVTLPPEALRQRGVKVAPMYPRMILIFGTTAFVTLTGLVIALMLLQNRRLRGARLEHDYGHPERHGAVAGASQAPDLTFHQCAMKIQFKLAHLEEKVNDLETVLMRRAGDLD